MNQERLKSYGLDDGESALSRARVDRRNFLLSPLIPFFSLARPFIPLPGPDVSTPDRPTIDHMSTFVTRLHRRPKTIAVINLPRPFRSLVPLSTEGYELSPALYTSARCFDLARKNRARGSLHRSAVILPIVRTHVELIELISPSFTLLSCPFLLSRKKEKRRVESTPSRV